MHRKAVSLLYLASVGTYWMSISLAMGMAVPLLTHWHFSNAETGLILAAINIVSILISLPLSSFADKSKAKHVPMIAAADLFIAAGALAFLLVVPFSKPVFSVAYILLAASLLAIGPVYIKIYFVLEQIWHMPAYAWFRAFGSLCFVFMSFLSGALLKSHPLSILPVIHVPCIILQLACLILCLPVLRNRDQSLTEFKVTGKSGYGIIIKHNLSLLLLLGSIFLIFMVHNNISSFKIRVLENVGAGPSDTALLNGVAVLSEIPVMLLYGRVKKKNSAILLALSFVFFLIKMIAISSAASIGAVFAAFALQSLSFGLYAPVIVDYIRERYPMEQTGRLQGLINSVPILGSVIGAQAMGWALDRFPLISVLRWLSVITAFGMAVGLLSLKIKR